MNEHVLPYAGIQPKTSSARVQGLAPRYADHFEPGSLLRLWREGMYVCRDTYEILRNVLGYRTHYVNYGLWPDGFDTVEPGRELALLVARALQLQPGDRLIDAGSGLGQGAADVCRAFDLAAVAGVNPCVPQVDFARALVAYEGLSDRVVFHAEDACHFAKGAGRRGFTHAMAIECITHFPDPQGFLSTLRTELPSGGRVAFAVVVSNGPETGWRKPLLRLFSGVSQRRGEDWTRALEEAGYGDIERIDITEQVIPPAVAYCRWRLSEHPEILAGYDAVTRYALHRFVDLAEASVSEGRLGYEVHVGRVP